MARRAATTMLERAKARTMLKLVPTLEEIEVALAWMRGELTLTQAAAGLYGESTATGSVGGKVLYRVAVCLRAAYQQGLLKDAA